MNILIISQYYYPEESGAAVWVPQLACDLVRLGHRVTVLTAFPNYPRRVVFEGYQRRIYQRETIEGVNVMRSWIYANPSDRHWSRLLNWGSFCFSALCAGALSGQPVDAIYVIAPPLPLAVSAAMLGFLKRCPVVCNVQDIYPLIAVELGILKNRQLIRFFEWMELFVYRRATRVVGISDGFKAHIIKRGVPECKVDVVPNWADPDLIRPGCRLNAFRQEHGLGESFICLYSGNLSHNSGLESVLDAAELMGCQGVRFVIVGDGVKKAWFVSEVARRRLANVLLCPLQPLERYSEVLAAADVTLVAVNSHATLASVPSKVFKQMAAARPVIAIVSRDNELYRMVEAGGFGVAVPPGDGAALRDAVMSFMQNPGLVQHMGMKAREALLERYSRVQCVGRIARAIEAAARSADIYSGSAPV